MCIRDSAYTVVSDFFPKWEQRDAKEMAARIGARHEVIHLDVLHVPEIAQNGPKRCYHCKKHLFSAILERARAQGITTLCDGSNEDDKGDYRPGMQMCIRDRPGHWPVQSAARSAVGRRTHCLLYTSRCV